MELIEKSMQKIHTAIPTLEELKIEHEKKNKFSFKQTIIVSAVSLFAGALLSLIISLLIG